MPLQCNIDPRGKLVRLIYGVILTIVGVTLIFSWARNSDGAWRWIVSIAVTLTGLFAVFESRAGWCVVRAMGFKTPF